MDVSPFSAREISLDTVRVSFFLRLLRSSEFISVVMETVEKSPGEEFLKGRCYPNVRRNWV